jgi:hypothetical protein
LKFQAFFIQRAEQRFDLANHFLKVVGQLAGYEDCAC